MLESYLSNFADAILPAVTTPRVGTHLTTRFGSARIGEWILISLRRSKAKMCYGISDKRTTEWIKMYAEGSWLKHYSNWETDNSVSVYHVGLLYSAITDKRNN